MLPDKFWIVVSQHDTNPTGFHRKLPGGPIVHESPCLTEDEAERTAEQIGARFGWITILEVDGTQVKYWQRKQPTHPATPTMGEQPAMPNPAKPLGWCDNCGGATGNLYPSDKLTTHCERCGRSKP